MRIILASLLMLTSLVGAPTVSFGDLHFGDLHDVGPHALCSTMAAPADCPDASVPASDGASCADAPVLDRHCCPDRQCLSAHGGVVPHGAALPFVSGGDAYRALAAHRLYGADLAPGARPPRSQA